MKDIHNTVSWLIKLHFRNHDICLFYFNRNDDDDDCRYKTCSQKFLMLFRKKSRKRKLQTDCEFIYVWKTFHEIIINLQTFIFSQNEMTTSFPKAQITSVSKLLYIWISNDKSEEKMKFSPKKKNNRTFSYPH